MAKGDSKRQQKRRKNIVIEDIQKFTIAKNAGKIEKKNKKDVGKSSLKGFRFSQIVAKIQGANKQNTQEVEPKESSDENSEKDESFLSADDSVDDLSMSSEKEDTEVPTVIFEHPKNEGGSKDLQMKEEQKKGTGQQEKSNNLQIKESSSERNAKYYPAGENVHGVCGILLLKNSMEVPVHGKFQIEVLKGKVSILGYEISPNEGQVPVFSPEVSARLKIQESSCDQKVRGYDSPDYEQIKELFKEKCQEIKQEILIHNTVVLLRKMKSLEMDFVCRYKMYQKLFAEPPTVKDTESDEVGSIDLSRWKEPVQEILQTLSEGTVTRILLCGNKNTGKSTFSRFLINAMLSRFAGPVFFLECDVGQTEFTPPGIMSLSKVSKPLLGPPFTHQAHPVMSLFYGRITSKDEPTRYVSCIKEAIQFYIRHHASEGPLVVNTQGWVKGLGLALLVDTIRVIEPSLVLQFKSQAEVERGFKPLCNEAVEAQVGWVTESNGRKSASDHLAADESNTQYRIIETPVKHSTEHQQFKSADYRQVSLLAYFSRLFISESTSTTRDQTSMVERPISCLVPRIVYWKDVAVHVIHCEITPRLIMASLNFSVVSLSSLHPSMIAELPKDTLPDGPKFLRYNPIASHIGYGFIRNIDVEQKAFIILTPVPYENLLQVNALLRGSIDAPFDLVHDYKSTSEQLYCTPETQSVIRGARARKPRFNLKRRRFNTPSAKI